MGCGRSKPETKPAATTTTTPEPAPAPVSEPPETATTTATGATTLTLHLTGQANIFIDTSLIAIGFQDEFMYIRLGVTDIQSPVGTVITSKPVLTIYHMLNSSTNFTLVHENLVVDTFSNDNTYLYIYKVKIAASEQAKLNLIKVKIAWQRPPGGPTTTPIEIHEFIKQYVSTESNIITDSGGVPEITTTTEPFTNYLSIEGYMDDHPLLGKSYAKF